MVGLSENLVDRLPSQLSGGQLQRASIARAIATDPDVVVLDEPTAQLSPEAEKYVLAILDELQQRLGLTYVYISHDLSLVRSICDRVLIMYLGQIVEVGTAAEIFERPQHPYTRTLVGSILRPDPRQRSERAVRERVVGEIPSPIDLPKGCFLAGRCEHVTDRCRSEPQALEPMPDGRPVRCWQARAGDLVDPSSALGVGAVELEPTDAASQPVATPTAHRQR
jgi:oligopeptide/dipeptide ABC transporter ATP-binding protein